MLKGGNQEERGFLLRAGIAPKERGLEENSCHPLLIIVIGLTHPSLIQALRPVIAWENHGALYFSTREERGPVTGQKTKEAASLSENSLLLIPHVRCRKNPPSKMERENSAPKRPTHSDLHDAGKKALQQDAGMELLYSSGSGKNTG
ncbi:hypothetical protein [Bacillus xiapuensis]|uniref:hypothetical protein n=1 Tax=Bacillus xiapuensis TaxID=2014075 RepID=UPI001E53F0B6|nr:hypothetical protein [Bacillus xiapuensis]